MYFIMKIRTGSPITETEFLILMKRCSNLTELIFVNVNPWYYVQYMISNKVKLPKLEAILFGCRSPQYITEGYKTQLMFQYRQTLHQLCIDIGPKDLTFLGMASITRYLSQFVNLKYLYLNTSCSIVFDNLVRACPQLQILKLRMSGKARFNVSERPITGSQSYTLFPVVPKSQLETLDIQKNFVTLQLHEYLERYCKYLSKLTLHEDPADDLASLFGGFRISDTADALPINNISLKLTRKA